MIRGKDSEGGKDEQKGRETKGKRLTWAGAGGDRGKETTWLANTDVRRQEVNENMPKKFCRLQEK